MKLDFRRKYPLIKQYDQVDCGPACLLSVLKFYKGNISLVHLGEIKNSSTILNLVTLFSKKYWFLNCFNTYSTHYSCPFELLDNTE